MPTETKTRRPEAAIAHIIITVVLLFVGGWTIDWGKQLRTRDALVVENNGWAIRVQTDYYGMSFHARFFDSPAISWALFFAVFGITPIIFVIPKSEGNPI
jgi:hypothetical protein